MGGFPGLRGPRLSLLLVALVLGTAIHIAAETAEPTWTDIAVEAPQSDVGELPEDSEALRELARKTMETNPKRTRAPRRTPRTVHDKKTPAGRAGHTRKMATADYSTFYMLLALLLGAAITATGFITARKDRDFKKDMDLPDLEVSNC